MKRQLEQSETDVICGQSDKKERLDVFDIYMLKKNQNNLKKLYTQCLILNQAKHYQNFIYKQQTFKIGDVVHLYDNTQRNPYVAKIRKIIKLPEVYEQLYFLQVEWYLRKGDFLLPTKYQRYIDHIATGEVFPSGQLEYVYIQSIRHKVIVGKKKLFQQYGGTDALIYFTRASYSFSLQQFTPDPSEWEKSCICQMPINPQLTYVQCQNCQLWFHTSCVIEPINISQSETFICSQCKIKTQKYQNAQNQRTSKILNEIDKCQAVKNTRNSLQSTKRRQKSSSNCKRKRVIAKDNNYEK